MDKFQVGKNVRLTSRYIEHMSGSIRPAYEEAVGTICEFSGMCKTMAHVEWKSQIGSRLPMTSQSISNLDIVF